MPTLKKGRGGRRNRDGTGGATPPTRKRAPRPPVPPDAGQYLNRELSVLAFFRRVLEEAQDERNPLLERVKFLAIVGSILAEFFMVRVAGIRQQIEAGVVERSPDGMTPEEQLTAMRETARGLMCDARDCLHDLLPKLAAA